jgi:hypothetical protein
LNIPKPIEAFLAATLLLLSSATTRIHGTAMATSLKVRFIFPWKSKADGYQASTARTLPFQLDKNQIIIDLSTERPQWILSAYGPGRNAPEQLFGGPVREQSFEEIHLLHRIAERSGNVQHAVC